MAEPSVDQWTMNSFIIIIIDNKKIHYLFLKECFRILDIILQSIFIMYSQPMHHFYKYVIKKNRLIFILRQIRDIFEA